MIVRRAKRLVAALSVLVSVPRLVRTVERLGFEEPEVRYWDIDQPIDLARERTRRRIRGLTRAVVVVGRRDDVGRTVYQAAHDQVTLTCPDTAENYWTPSITVGGVALAIAADTVFRVAVGPPAHHIDDQVSAIRTLRDSNLPAWVGGLIPAAFWRSSALTTWSETS